MARYYEPEQGVFTAYDPDPGDEDDPQTMNGYNYANNNPVMLADPDGLWAGVVLRLGAKFGKYVWKYAKKGTKKVKVGVKKWWRGYKLSPQKKKSVKRSTKAVNSISSQTKDHIMDSKHDWNSVTNGNWGDIKNIVNRTMRKGKESAYGKTGVARKKTMKYGKRTIVVTFIKKKGKIIISNAWVKTK